MPAHVDVLAGYMIDDFQESIRRPIGIGVRFNTMELVDHVTSFPWLCYNSRIPIAFTPAKPFGPGGDHPTA